MEAKSVLVIIAVSEERNMKWGNAQEPWIVPFCFSHDGTVMTNVTVMLPFTDAPVTEALSAYRMFAIWGPGMLPTLFCLSYSSPIWCLYSRCDHANWWW